MFSVNRDTREPIVHTRAAQPGEDRLLYKRVGLLDQAALGDVETVRWYADKLAERVFRGIRKVSFKTVGVATTIKALDFIVVDGDEFRVLSISRKYNADSNEFVNEYNAEWLGG